MQQTENRPNGRQSIVSPGLRLTAFLEANPKLVPDREQDNDRRIRLYACGGHWAAFDRSACQLCLRFPDCETAVLRVASRQFPVVKASVPGELLRSRRMPGEEPEHVIQTAPELSMSRYKAWYKQRIDA